jgi:hypothetical protein
MHTQGSPRKSQAGVCCMYVWGAWSWCGSCAEDLIAACFCWKQRSSKLKAACQFELWQAQIPLSSSTESLTPRETGSLPKTVSHGSAGSDSKLLHTAPENLSHGCC